MILASAVAAIFIIFLFFLASNNDKKAKFERDYNLKNMIRINIVHRQSMIRKET